MRTFERRGTVISAGITQEECAIILKLVAETVDILDAPVLDTAFINAHMVEDSRCAPQDKVLLRLLPRMSDNDAIADELRALTEDDIRLDKSKRLQEFAEIIEEASITGYVEIEQESVASWLAALTDLRLVLSAVLEIETAANAEAVENKGIAVLAGGQSIRSSAESRNNEDSIDPFFASFYVALTWWQASLLDVVDGSC